MYLYVLVVLAQKITETIDSEILVQEQFALTYSVGNIMHVLT